MGDDAFRPAPIPLAREQQVHLAIAPDQAELPNPLERLFSNASTRRSLPARGGGSERIRDRRHVGTEGPALESCLVVSDPGKSGRPVSHPESRSGDMRHDHLHRMPGSSRFVHSRFVHSRFIHVLLHPWETPPCSECAALASFHSRGCTILSPPYARFPGSLMPTIVDCPQSFCDSSVESR